MKTQTTVKPRRLEGSYEIFIKYANEGENYFSYIIVIISTLTSGGVVCDHILLFFRAQPWPLDDAVYYAAWNVHSAMPTQEP